MDAPEKTQILALKLWNRVLDYCRAMAPSYGEILERCSPLSYQNGIIKVKCQDVRTLESLAKKRVKEEVNKILKRATNQTSETVTGLAFDAHGIDLLDEQSQKKGKVALENLEPVFYDEGSLKGMRKKMQLSQAKVADAMGVSTLTYANWEKQSTRPKWENIEKLSKMFGASIDAILTAIGGGKTSYEGFTPEADVLGEKGEPVRYHVVFEAPEHAPDWKLDPWWERQERRLA